MLDTGAGEKVQGHVTAEQHDLGPAGAEGLAAAEIEGHAGPIPGVHGEPHGHVGLGGGVRRYSIHLAIAGHHRAVDGASGVLPPDHFARAHRADRVEHLHLLIPQGFRVE